MISHLTSPDGGVFIVLATYNRGEKCTKVIQNILDQNISNWYLLVIDDGSENSHSKIITIFIKQIQDSRVNYVKNPNNIKLPSTLNVGINRFLEGDWSYFTWISDDNIYLPNYINNLYSLKADFAHSAWNRGNQVAQTEYKTFEDIVKRFQGLASYMWSRKAIEIIGKYNPKYDLVLDLEYLYRTYYCIKHNIKYSPYSEMIYVIHDDADSVKYGARLSIQDRQMKQEFFKK